MTRTTDPDPGPFQPLGEKVARTPTPPPPSRRTPGDDLPAGIERGPDGRLRTNLPLPKD